MRKIAWVYNLAVQGAQSAHIEPTVHSHHSHTGGGKPHLRPQLAWGRPAANLCQMFPPTNQTESPPVTPFSMETMKLGHIDPFIE